MDEERAHDALKNNCLGKVVRAYKFHHPTFRNTLVEFLYAVIDKAGNRNLEVATMVNLTLADYKVI